MTWATIVSVTVARQRIISDTSGYANDVSGNPDNGATHDSGMLPSPAYEILKTRLIPNPLDLLRSVAETRKLKLAATFFIFKFVAADFSLRNSTSNHPDLVSPRSRA